MFSWGQLLFQIHAVMQQSEYINHIAPLGAADAEHDEVSALASVSRNMERPDTVSNFRPFLDPNDIGAGA